MLAEQRQASLGAKQHEAYFADLLGFSAERLRKVWRPVPEVITLRTQFPIHSFKFLNIKRIFGDFEGFSFCKVFTVPCFVQAVVKLQGYKSRVKSRRASQAA